MGQTSGNAEPKIRYPHPQSTFDRRETRRLLAKLCTSLRPQLLVRYIDLEQGNALASLGKVVVYGCPPLAILICSRVSLKSFPAIPLEGAEAVD